MIETLSPRAPSGGRAEVIQTELKLEDESFLTDDFLRQLINVGEVDILVGLPTHNNAKTIGSIVLQFPSWGWSVASGLVSVALGVMLAMQWPTSGTWFIGFAVGLDLILYGWALLMFAAAVKKLSTSFA